jgi:hypothetical protein
MSRYCASVRADKGCVTVEALKWLLGLLKAWPCMLQQEVVKVISMRTSEIYQVIIASAHQMQFEEGETSTSWSGGVEVDAKIDPYNTNT